MNLGRVADYVHTRFSRGRAIFIYHRVTRLDRDPQLLAVTPEHFEEHLEVLRRRFQVVPLAQFASAFQANLPANAVAITFDDGYVDNLIEAKPILERKEIPATVFVASGFVGLTSEFWWDELDRIFLGPEDRGWDIEQSPDSAPQRRQYAEYCKQLRTAPKAEREKTIEELRKTKHAGNAGRRTHRTMTAAELNHLIDGGLIDIGAHTASHPVLSTLEPAEQLTEIKTSKVCLEDITGKPVMSFAYPYGGKDDYNRHSVEFVQRTGFEIACSNFAGLVWPSTSRFELPRFLVRDSTGDEFERRLARLCL